MERVACKWSQLIEWCGKRAHARRLHFYCILFLQVLKTFSKIVANTLHPKLHVQIKLFSF